MIALSTVWGRDAFDAPASLYLAMRETFPVFELAWPPWPGRPSSPREDLARAKVRAVSLWAADPLDDSKNPAGGAPSRRRAQSLILDAAAVAKSAGVPLLCMEGGFVPRVEGWDEFRTALFRAGSPGRSDLIARGLEHRRAGAGHALENLARSLHALCRADPDLIFCLQVPPDPSGLPAPHEAKDLILEVGARNLGFAQVAGRAAFLEATAGWPAEAWLEAVGHVTRAIVADDGTRAGHGLLPGTGSVDYRALRRQAPSRAPVIVRPPQEASEAEVKAAAGLLATAGF